MNKIKIPFMIKFSGSLLAKLAFFALLAMLTSCSLDDNATPPCVTGECKANFYFPVEADSNGYYHIKLDWDSDYYPYFVLDVFATKVSQQYRYNDYSAVEAVFDSDTYWVIGDTLSYQVNSYNPFTGDYTYNGTLLPTSSKTVLLTQFAGMTVNIVQNSTIYFNDIVEDPDLLYSKRVVGPFAPSTIGDTVTINMEVFWDAGSQSVLKNNYVEKFIVE